MPLVDYSGWKKGYRRMEMESTLFGTSTSLALPSLTETDSLLHPSSFALIASMTTLALVVRPMKSFR